MYGNCSKCDFSMCFCRQTSPWAMRFSLLFFLVFLSVLYLSLAQGKSLMCPVYYVNHLWHWPKKGSILFLWFLHAFFFMSFATGLCLSPLVNICRIYFFWKLQKFFLSLLELLFISSTQLELQEALWRQMFDFTATHRCL